MGGSGTLGLVLRNAGDADTSISGRLPDAGVPFARVGTGVFSGVKPDRPGAVEYTFAPTAVGPFSETLIVESNAGNVAVTLRGTGGSVAADFVIEGDVDLADLQTLQACFNGPNWPAACP